MHAARRLQVSGLLIAILLTAGCAPRPEARYVDSSGAVPLGVGDGRPTVVHLWGSWCPPCRAELPALARYLEASRPDAPRVLVVSTGESLQTSRRYLAGKGFTFTTFGDPDGALRAYLSAHAVPTTVLFAADGTELERIVGAAPWDDSLFRGRLAALASGDRTPFHDTVPSR